MLQGLNEDYVMATARVVEGSVSTLGLSLQQSVALTGQYLGRPARFLHIMGLRNAGWSSTSVLGDIAEYLDTSQPELNVPTVGQTYYVRSTSASDTAIGAGTKAVRVSGLGVTGLRQERDYLLSGTTPVSVGNDWSFFQCLESQDGAQAVGTITLTQGNGAVTVATTYGQIKPGTGKSLCASYKVPSNATAYIISWDIEAISNTMDTRIRATVMTGDRSLSSVWHFQDIMYLASNTNATADLPFLKLPANARLKVSAYPGGTAAGNRCNAGFSVLELED